ncbi:MAG: hypothetical protein HC804_01240 [Anaerolineae bacterium]|nr:hypothetical protein [Anaerolineae bacterium]
MYTSKNQGCSSGKRWFKAGRAVEILLLLTVTFLLLNLITSFIMNRINAAVQFTER